MASVLQKSSGDSAGYDAVVGGAETLLTGMGQVLNAASSSVKLKPGAPTNGTNRTATPTCTPFDFECKKKLEARLTTTLPPTTSPEGDDDDEDDDDDDGGEELDDDAKGVSLRVLLCVIETGTRHKSTFSQHFKDSEEVRIGSIIIFHLSKAKFFIICDV